MLHLVYVQVGDFIFQMFEEPTGLENRGVLDIRGDNVITFFAPGERYPFDCQIVGFRPATGEDDSPRLTVEQKSNLPTGFFYSFLC